MQREGANDHVAKKLTDALQVACVLRLEAA
jgi:hypothetical protein